MLPLLVAAGIGAHRTEDRSGSKITLRKNPTDDATDATTAENLTGKPDTGGNSVPSNATANATPNPADRAEGGISGGIRSGNFSGPASFDAEPGENVTVAELKMRRAEALRPASVREFLSRPPTWLQDQMRHCREQGCSANQLKALAASMAAELYGDATKGAEILPEVEAFMTHGRLRMRGVPVSVYGPRLIDSEEEVARRVEEQVKAELHLMFEALDGALPDEQFRKVWEILVKVDEVADRKT